jgi:gentisate 1,2-dioxygenase
MDENQQKFTGEIIPLETSYAKWQREEGVPVHTGFWVDLCKIELGFWKRKGCLGAYINLADQESLDAYVVEMLPGKHTEAQRHMYEETIYILKGRGSTTIWLDGSPKQTITWQEGSLFSPPLNCWHQHFNTSDQPARYVAVTTAPLYINLFHSKDFIYRNSFVFEDRYCATEGYFSEIGVEKAVSIPDADRSAFRNRLNRIWKTNFILDVSRFDKLTANRYMYAEGSSKSKHFGLSENTMAGHIVESQSGYYKKAHRHGPGAHLIIVQGRGYSLIWEDGKERVRVDWSPGIMLSPPDMWWHQHFSTGSEPTRQLALRWANMGEYIGTTNWKRYSEDFGEQIEYEDEDPEIRKTFESECRANGVQVKMPPVTYPQSRR